MGNCCDTRKNEVENPSGFRPATASGVPGLSNGHGNSPDFNQNVTRIKKTEKSKTGSLPTPRSEGDILSSPNLRAFTLSELKNATKNFCHDNLIGEGGFGYVYKGQIDEAGGGVAVAVKKLKPGGFQGHKEWLSEVNHLGQLRHPNLVKLIGYCLDGENQLLVYEYMPKGSLENHLFKHGARALPWAMRIKVAIDAARGLSFLHDSEQQVIYRDFKASNILLDSDFNAKLSDFGLAKAGPTGDHSHVSTQILGTQGYAAPEYMATGRLTWRCDVYSFGVVMMELLTGRRAVDKARGGVEENLVEWARPYLGDRRKFSRIMDTKLAGQYPQRAAFILGLLALQCTSEAKLRPQMSQVLGVLEGLSAAKLQCSSSRSKKQTVSTSVSRSPVRSGKDPSPSPPYMTPLGSPSSSSHMNKSSHSR